MKKIFFLSLPLAALVLLSACGGKTLIDWADFVKLNDTSYISDGDVIPKEYVGDKIGEVTGNVPGEIDGEYSSDLEKNGDAAFLPVGTELYAVKGYPSGDYVAALVDGQYKLYKTMESETLPFAVESTSGETNRPDSSKDSASSDTGTGGTTNGSTNGGTTSGSSATQNGGASFDSEVINYVRTYGNVGALIPNGRIVATESALKAYYKSKGIASEFDSTGSLADAVSHYNASFFKTKALAVIDFEETSGSNRHEVTDIRSKAGVLTVTIKRIAPEVGTCDMAHWYILVPVERASYSGLKVELNGKNYDLSDSGKASGGEGAIEPDIEQVSNGTASAPPSLGLQTQSGDCVSYTLATMGGTYSWEVPSTGGQSNRIESDGDMPYEINDIAKINGDGTDGSVLLVTHGIVKSMTVKRYAQSYSGSGNGESVKVSKSTFAVKSGSYYEITVKYEQGTATYGFICKA